jgi:uncharacterized protein YcnI
MRVQSLLAAAAVAFLASSPAHAHVVLETQQAAAGSFYRATFNIGHGCDGTATTRVRVRIPNGVTNVKPQPKPGWEVATVKEKLDKPAVGDHGTQVSEVVREVIWSGGKLLDAHFDQFAMQVRLPDAPDTTIYFPVVQECDKGVHRWIEIPEAGKTARDYKEPAPALRLTKGAGAH